MPKKKTILVAPLHWGLGHATRCIPIIEALLERDFNVIIASDGAALALLRKEFPHLPSLSLPSYDIRYPKNGRWLTWRLLLKLPQLKRVISEEKKLLSTWVQTEKIDGIISDNRPGVRHDGIPSVYITHQIRVLSGITTTLSTRLHQALIKKFASCWVPDVASEESFSGIMGHVESTTFPVRFIGILSRMKPQPLPKTIDILCVLSGPEPQRSLLEDIFVRELKDCKKKVVLVQGLPASSPSIETIGSIEKVPFMKAATLEKTMNQSALIICRSGYTGIMDLAVLQKKAFFIPTPGQFEQQYLAQRLEEKKIAPYCLQQEFTLKKLATLSSYGGFVAPVKAPNFDSLFGLFEGK